MLVVTKVVLDLISWYSFFLAEFENGKCTDVLFLANGRIVNQLLGSILYAP